MADQAKSSILLPILRQIPLFSELDETLHQEIIEHIILMYYPAKYTIFPEGAEGDALYIVKTGAVEIKRVPKEEGDLPSRIAEIGPNGFFGEMALISEVPRNATAVTVTDSEIFILSKDDFKKLLDTNPQLAAQISATVVLRSKENNRS